MDRSSAGSRCADRSGSIRHSAIAFVLAVTALSAAVKGEAWSVPTAGQIISNATYTQLFLGYPLINPVFWTLCYEVQFYLALCLWLMLVRRARLFGYGSMFAVAMAFGTGMVVSPVEGLFVSLWHCFFLGVLAYWAHCSRAALIGLALLCVALALSPPNMFTIFSMVSAVGLYVARQTGFVHNGLSWRPIAFLGTISYSLYLTHNPVTGASFFLLAKVGAPQWAALLLTLGACVIVAYVFWWTIERPSMNLAHKVKLRAQVEPTPTATSPNL